MSPTALVLIGAFSVALMAYANHRTSQRRNATERDLRKRLRYSENERLRLAVALSLAQLNDTRSHP